MNCLRSIQLGFVFAFLFIAILAVVSPTKIFAEERKTEECDQAEKPNIVFIFADDQAFDTIRATGNREIETPNLDRLVKNGTTFTHAYNMGGWSGAICVASRHMLITGRTIWNAKKIGTNGNLCQREIRQGRFWSENMKNAGYDTYFTGKWHIKSAASSTFDYVAHSRPGMPNQTPEGYNRPLEGQPDVWKPWDKSKEGYWKGGKHWSEVLADDSELFLKQAAQKKKPFFMYLAFNAPHDPRQAPQKFVEKYPLENIAIPKSFLPEYPFKNAMGCSPDLRDERLAPFPRTEHAVKVHRQEYYAIISHMDEQIGRILKAVEETGQAKNTYIIFTADHGLSVGRHGLIGKQSMFDHSMRVPFIISGPGIKKDVKMDGEIYLQDGMATTLELAKIKKPKHVEFKSVLPILNGQRKQNYDAIYGAYLNLQRSVTFENHKLILYPKINKALLFDLKNDPHEMTDLASQETSQPRLKTMFAQFVKLQKQMHDPLIISADLTQWNKTP